MEKIEMKVEIEGNNISLDLKYSDNININEFCNIIEGIKSNYVNAVTEYCVSNNIDIVDYVKSTTMKSFAKEI